MKKYNFAVCTGFLTACLCCANLNASAYTADDVANKARESGWPETLIQTGYNQWASGDYTQEQLDEVYYSVLDYNEQNEEFFCNQFGIDYEEYKQKSAEKNNQSETQPDSESEDQSETKSESGSQHGNSSGTQSGSDSQSETKKNHQNFVSNSDFINMSMEEKQNYMNSLSADDKIDFLSSLSPEARNSIIKQASTEDKVNIMQKYIDTASAMGMNVTVDEITDKDISVTIRNDDGIVIDKADVGIVIDETGISHTKPLLFAGIGILASAVGFAWLYRYIRRTEQD